MSDSRSGLLRFGANPFAGASATRASRSAEPEKPKGKAKMKCGGRGSTQIIEDVFKGKIDDEFLENFERRERERNNEPPPDEEKSVTKGKPVEGGAPKGLKLSKKKAMNKRWVSMPNQRRPQRQRPGPGQRPQRPPPPPPQMNMQRYQPPYEPLFNQIQRAIERNPKLGNKAIRWKPHRKLTPQQAVLARRALNEMQEQLQQMGPQLRQLSRGQFGGMAVELIERAAAHLNGEGVDFSVVYHQKKGTLHIQISPEGDHPLNKLAASLARTCDDLKVLYFPAFLMSTPGAAAAYSEELNQIWLGHETVLTGSPSEITLAHEIRHAMRRHQVRKGGHSPYHGAAIKETGLLPSATTNQYQQFMGLDEMDTYAHTIRASIHQLSRNVDKGDVEAIRRDISSLFGFVLIGTECCLRTISIAKQSIAELRSREAKPKYEIGANGQVVASFSVGRAANKRYQLQMPLIASEGIDDPENQAHLDAQLEWMLRAAQSHLTDYRLVQRAFEKLVVVDKADELKLIVQALRPILAERKVATNRDHQPQTFTAAVEQFNQNLDALWNKKAPARA